jgi:hypothetical protein
MRFLLAALCAICVSACAPTGGTGNSLLDEVVKRENVDGGCVHVGPTTDFVRFGSAIEFRDQSVRKAAEAASTRAMNSGNVSDSVDPDTMKCWMQVNRPILSSGYAFVAFSNAGGELGTYAFRSANNRWVVVERNHYAYW